MIEGQEEETIAAHERKSRKKFGAFPQFAWIGIGAILGGFVIELIGPACVYFFFALGGVVPADWVANADHHLSAVAVISLLFKEVGVAFVVAWVITNGVEAAAREREIERHERQTTETAKAVIHGLYALQHEPSFVKAVVETNLEAKIVRQGMTLKYKVRSLRNAEAQTVFPAESERAKDKFVILEMFSEYTFRNVSSQPQPVAVQYQVALRHGAGAKSISRATDVIIGDEDPLTSDQISKAILNLGHEEEVRYRWDRILQPGRTLKVTIYAQTLKERSDSETWGSFFPTMGNIAIEFEVPDQNVFGVRPLSNGMLVEHHTVPKLSTKRCWILNGPILRHNSLVFYWRTPEDDAQPQAAIVEVNPNQLVLEPAERTAVATEPTTTESRSDTFFQRIRNVWGALVSK